MSDDKWVHRSKGTKCRTCMWFVEKIAGTVESEVGRCRRHSPGQNGGPGWPSVFDEDWCGDHRLDENKLDKM